MEDKFRVFNIVLFGNKGVGKTTILKNILMKKFIDIDNYEHSISLEFFQHLIYPEIKEQIKDAFPDIDIYINFNEINASKKNLDDVNDSAFNNMHAGFFVLDLTNKKTIANINNWFKKVDENRTQRGFISPIIIIGTKVDDIIREKHIKREVSVDKIKDIKKEYRCYEKYEICALFDDDVKKVYKELLNALLIQQIDLIVENSDIIKEHTFTNPLTREVGMIKINKSDLEIIYELEKYLLNKIMLEEENIQSHNYYKVKNTRVVYLNLSIRKSPIIPKSIGNLNNLRELEIIGRFQESNIEKNFDSIPESITDLINLRKLRINYTQITKISENIGCLENLIELDLSYNNILHLPDSIFNLRNLQKLKINYNPLYFISEEIGKLKNLTQLELNGIRIDFIPESIKKLEDLEELSIFQNNLQYLPKELFTLNKLKSLNISDNYLTEIPYEIGSLTNLHILDFRDNFLTTVPESLQNLKKLKFLGIGNIDLWQELKTKIYDYDIIKLEEDDLYNTSINLQNKGIVVKKEFKINDFITLKLEYNQTNIYIAGQLFRQCKYLLLNIPVSNIEDFSDIDSIDEASERLNPKLEGKNAAFRGIKPETEFIGHCSNVQAWVENDYDSRILHRNLAFPMLKKLVELGEKKAERVFKEEIAKRFIHGNKSVRLFLINEKYLNYLNKDELDVLLNQIDENDSIFELIMSNYKV